MRIRPAQRAELPAVALTGPHAWPRLGRRRLVLMPEVSLASSVSLVSSVCLVNKFGELVETHIFILHLSCHAVDT